MVGNGEVVGMEVVVISIGSTKHSGKFFRSNGLLILQHVNGSTDIGGA